MVRSPDLERPDEKNCLYSTNIRTIRRVLKNELGSGGVFSFCYKHIGTLQNAIQSWKN